MFIPLAFYTWSGNGLSCFPIFLLIAFLEDPLIIVHSTIIITYNI